jgi:hypothetical protein
MKFRNISNKTLIVPGKGEIRPGGRVDLPKGFHNANFRRAETPGKKAEKVKIKKPRKKRKKTNEILS